VTLVADAQRWEAMVSALPFRVPEES